MGCNDGVHLLYQRENGESAKEQTGLDSVLRHNLKEIEDEAASLMTAEVSVGVREPVLQAE